LTVNAVTGMTVGAQNILIPNPRDIPGFVKELKKYKFNFFPGLNTLFNGLLNNEDFRKLDFASLQHTVGGGMAVQGPVAERWRQVTGCQLSEGYGMTEASPVISCNPFDSAMRIGTIGLPAPGTDMRIVDEDGAPLPPGPEHVGEIQAKGPQVMKGYWQRPEATAEVLQDGWLSTGDMGYMHPDGYFQIVDRKKGRDLCPQRSARMSCRFFKRGAPASRWPCRASCGTPLQ
jgi:long-chain acyl-CoA synthetase